MQAYARFPWFSNVCFDLLSSRAELETIRLMNETSDTNLSRVSIDNLGKLSESREAGSINKIQM